jgi:hypothetical protein
MLKSDLNFSLISYLNHKGLFILVGAKGYLVLHGSKPKSYVTGGSASPGGGSTWSSTGLCLAGDGELRGPVW